MYEPLRVPENLHRSPKNAAISDPNNSYLMLPTNAEEIGERWPTAYEYGMVYDDDASLVSQHQQPATSGDNLDPIELSRWRLQIWRLGYVCMFVLSTKADDGIKHNTAMVHGFHVECRPSFLISSYRARF